MLSVKKIHAEAAGSVVITFVIPPALRENFYFEPGQFLTLRTHVNGQEMRRNYSISSPRSQFLKRGEIEIGIRPVTGGVFSNWAATQLKVGDYLDVMQPEGKFTIKKRRAIHRVGFAVGSGITPILSIAASSLEEDIRSKFTLIYGNRRMSSVMFNEALQDLKDRFLSRFTMIHILSRQAQEVDLLQGRIDSPKIKSIIDALLPVKSMDEVFICGPESMIETTEKTLVDCGVAADRVYSERFTTSSAQAHKVQADTDASKQQSSSQSIHMTVVLDGKEHELTLNSDEYLLDAALHAGLDLPFSCKAGVCSTCRCKVIQGKVVMNKNFTLDEHELKQGFVLSCQSQAISPRVMLSFDHR